MILGVVLLNKPTYKMHPKDPMEIQRQVKELTSKGLVRESLSPCAVLTLLVLEKARSMMMCVDVDPIYDFILYPYILSFSSHNDVSFSILLVLFVFVGNKLNE